jgi:RNA polymerase primary sigma factor
MGLCRAIAAFDLERGVKFSTYAMWHIKESVRRALVFDKNSVKPVRTLERSRDVNINITMISFIENFDQEDALDGDDVSDDLHKRTLITSMLAAVDKILTDKEKYIVQHRYGFHGTELTYSDLANVLGLSTERVRQIENNALKKMWSHLRHNEVARLEAKSAASGDGALNLLQSKNRVS